MRLKTVKAKNSSRNVYAKLLSDLNLTSCKTGPAYVTARGGIAWYRFRMLQISIALHAEFGLGEARFET